MAEEIDYQILDDRQKLFKGKVLERLYPKDKLDDDEETDASRRTTKDSETPPKNHVDDCGADDSSCKIYGVPGPPPDWQRSDDDAVNDTESEDSSGGYDLPKSKRRKRRRHPNSNIDGPHPTIRKERITNSVDETAKLTKNQKRKLKKKRRKEREKEEECAAKTEFTFQTEERDDSKQQSPSNVSETSKNDLAEFLEAIWDVYVTEQRNKTSREVLEKDSGMLDNFLHLLRTPDDVPNSAISYLRHIQQLLMLSSQAEAREELARPEALQDLCHG